MDFKRFFSTAIILKFEKALFEVLSPRYESLRNHLKRQVILYPEAEFDYLKTIL
jgi:hypothetical protein